MELDPLKLGPFVVALLAVYLAATGEMQRGIFVLLLIITGLLIEIRGELSSWEAP